MVIKILKKNGMPVPPRPPEVIISAAPRPIKKVVSPTLRQQQAARIISENIGKPINKGEVLRQAGFAESTANTPGLVFDRPSFQAALDPVIRDLMTIRENVIDALKEMDMTKESVTSLNFLLKNLNHDIELLTGRPTDRLNHTLDPEEKAHLDDVLARAHRDPLPVEAKVVPAATQPM